VAFVSWQSILHCIEATQSGISDTFSLIFQGRKKYLGLKIVLLQLAECYAISKKIQKKIQKKNLNFFSVKGMAFVSWQSVLHGIEATQGGISDTFSLIFQGQG
jgi:hypothetical protein